MCYVHLTKEQMACPLLSADEWKGLMTEACENGMLRAILTGGECLTHPGFREIYGHLKSLGCEVTVLSNAALLDDEWLRYFEKYRPGAICVTLYGDSEDAYERVTGQRVFERVLSHIRAIREAGLPLEISVTPNRRLGEDVFGTIRVLIRRPRQRVADEAAAGNGQDGPGHGPGRRRLHPDFPVPERARRHRLYGVS